MVIIPDEEEPEEDDDPEPLIDVSEASVIMASQPQVSFLIKICEVLVLLMEGGVFWFTRISLKPPESL